MATTVTEKIIRIDVVTSAGAQRAIKALADDMKKVENSTAQMQRTLSSGFNNITGVLGKFSSFLGAFGIATGFGAISRAVLDSASAYQVLEQRLGLVLGTTEKATQATKEIFDIAKSTGREVDGVGKLYEKAARSAAQFGLSQANVKQITEGFSNSIRLSGASTQEAYASLVQFGQALASGRLQGDEFRSLMENNSVFMYEFAKAAGVSVAELRKMGTEGKLNAKFLFDTMLKQGADGVNMLERLNKMAEKVPLTFQQSFNSVKTGLVEFVGEFTKALGATSEDPLGLFGPIVKGITAMTQALKEMRIESDALGEGFWEKLFRIGTLYAKNFTVPGLIYKGASAIYDRVTGGGSGPTTLAGRIDKETNDAKAALERSETLVARIQKSQQDKLSAGGQLSPTDASVLRTAQSEVEKLSEAYIRLRKVQSDLRYGERYVEPAKPSKPKEEVSKDVENAREALARYVTTLKERAELQRAIYADENLNVETYKQKLDLQTALEKAQLGENSALAKAGELYLRQEETFRRLNASRVEYKKALEEETGALQKRSEKVQEIMQRDVAAMDALRGRTKASQEFSTDELERGLRSAREQRDALMTFSNDKREDPLVTEADRLVQAYEDALTLRKQLTEQQEIDKQRKAQDIVDRENFKRVDSLAKEINDDLKRGIAEGKAGASLYENIQKTFKEKAIDVVLNPITSLISRAMAQLADEFGRAISKQVYGAIAGQMNDPVGSLINLLGLGDPFATSSISTTYSLPISGVKLGGYPAKEGLSYVPFDNFPASLHRGERVLTAQENASYSGRPAVTIMHSPNIQIDSRTDQAQVYEIAFEASRRSNAALVDELSAQGVI